MFPLSEVSITGHSVTEVERKQRGLVWYINLTGGGLRYTHFPVLVLFTIFIRSRFLGKNFWAVHLCFISSSRLWISTCLQVQTCLVCLRKYGKNPKNNHYIFSVRPWVTLHLYSVIFCLGILYFPNKGGGEGYWGKFVCDIRHQVV